MKKAIIVYLYACERETVAGVYVTGLVSDFKAALAQFAAVLPAHIIDIQYMAWVDGTITPVTEDWTNYTACDKCSALVESNDFSIDGICNDCAKRLNATYA